MLSFDRLTNVAFSFTNHDERPALPPDAEGPAHTDRHQPAALRRAGAALLPGRGLRGGARRGRLEPALRDQLPELRPLQDLRHQGSAAEHRLDHTAGRRRAELPQHVTVDGVFPLIRAIESAVAGGIGSAARPNDPETPRAAHPRPSGRARARGRRPGDHGPSRRGVQPGGRLPRRDPGGYPGRLCRGRALLPPGAGARSHALRPPHQRHGQPGVARRLSRCPRPRGPPRGGGSQQPGRDAGAARRLARGRRFRPGPGRSSTRRARR